MTYGITSADKIIDRKTIVSASKNMRSLAAYFESIGKKVKKSRYYLFIKSISC